MAKNEDGSHDLTISFSGVIDYVDATYAFLQHTETMARVKFEKIEATEDEKRVILRVPAGTSGKYRIVVRVMIGGKPQEVRNVMVDLLSEGATR